MFSWIKVCVIALGLTHFSAYTFAEQHNSISINELSGKVIYRGLYDANWKELTSSVKLSKHDIIKTYDDSHLEMNVNINGTDTLVRISSPTILRLDSDVMRKIRSKEFVITDLPPYAGKLRKNDPTFIDSISSAFNKLKVINLSAKNVRSDDDSKFNSVDTLYKKLEVTYPQKSQPFRLQAQVQLWLYGKN